MEEQSHAQSHKSNWTDNKIGCDGLRVLCEALKVNTTITKLDLRGLDKKQVETPWLLLCSSFCDADNPISTPQATVLADMLGGNTTLTELYLGSENTISS